ASPIPNGIDQFAASTARLVRVHLGARSAQKSRMEREMEAAQNLLLARSRKHRLDKRGDLRRACEPQPRNDLQDLDVARGELELRHGARPPLKARQSLQRGRHRHIVQYTSC